MGNSVQKAREDPDKDAATSTLKKLMPFLCALRTSIHAQEGAPEDFP